MVSKLTQKDSRKGDQYELFGCTPRHVHAVRAGAPASPNHHLILLTVIVADLGLQLPRPFLSVRLVGRNNVHNYSTEFHSNLRETAVLLTNSVGVPP